VNRPGRVGTVVVGGGPAGLATSAHLAAAGLDHVVLERGRVGETWRTQRWTSFRLNTPGWMSGLADPDRFGTARDLVDALERRAATLPVREGVGVRGVWRRRGGGYLVATDEEVLLAENVVAASGAQRVPRIPRVADDVTAHGVEHLHVADYRDPAALPPGAVLVVGGGQSGVQIAGDLLAAGRRVYVATSPVPRVPRRYRGRDITEWWRELGRLETPSGEVSDAIRHSAQPLVGPVRPATPPGDGSDGSLSLQRLARAGAVLLGRLVAASGAHLFFDGDPVEHAARGDAAAARQRAMIDAWIAAAGVAAPAPEPDDPPLRRGEAPERPVLDLRAEGIGTVLWATGFGGDFGWLRMPILQPSGLPIHRGVATAGPGLFTVGLPWLTMRTSGTLYGIERDAAAVAVHIATRAQRARRAS
jgi:putative flavoprotein involved in K+ transport